tara:strand:+ start:316 stop:1068 length:753 start_codon:yes stop_codon:yes gene_type:complete
MTANTVTINASTTNATSVQNTLLNMQHMYRAFAGGATVCILKDTAVVKNMILRKQGVTHEITLEQFKELLASFPKNDDGTLKIGYPEVNGRMSTFRKKHPNLGGLTFGKWVRANITYGDNWAESDISKEMATYDLHNFTGSVQTTLVVPATPAEVPAPTLSGIDDLLAGIAGAPTVEPTPAPSLESWTVKAGDEVREYELPSEPVAVAEEASILMIKADLVKAGVYTVAQADRTAEKRLRKVHGIIFRTN